MSLESPLTVWLFICFARLQSLFSAQRPTEREIELLKAVHLRTPLTDQSQFNSDKPALFLQSIRIYTDFIFSLFFSCRDPFMCLLSARPSCGIEDAVTTP